MPGPDGAAIFPDEDTVTGGSIMSCSQYRFDADTSPGKVNPGSVDIAILWARPMPDSSMPPHQTGTACSDAYAWIFLASKWPPTLPNLTLMIRQESSSIACLASSNLSMDSSRQIGVSSSRWSFEWSTKSPAAKGCSIIKSLNRSSSLSMSISARLYAEFASTESKIEGNLERIDDTRSTSRPGLILILMR